MPHIGQLSQASEEELGLGQNRSVGIAKHRAEDLEEVES
jgi:hypothetical protein